ncbi:hypothetical protein CCAX7_11240 [Capsulimonas corticalis]|uniref:Uncharacterized protein n=1 Tax=Capsulimonas corticalis TaxID=2219043 RepID=A0A402CUP4_9BACT|nr:hypothetical protein [Capsulimonas corticalis]BDI29073.1 hypothetical protein CCAX7_11240 [Capsulimonas corticalis]
MDTSYEKVCPGCGKSTAISEKFCAGCGHQYRTVFHDSASGGALAAAAPAPAGDLRSTPIALIAVTVFLVLLCVLVLLFTNRSTTAVAPAPAPTAIVAPASPSLGAAELMNQIHFGQTPAAVRAIAGEPSKITRNMAGGLNSEDWYYPRGGRTVQVHFNGSQVVDALNTF